MSGSDLLLSPEKVNQLRVIDLRSELRNRNLASNGKKSVLCERLITHLNSIHEKPNTNPSDSETVDFFATAFKTIQSPDFNINAIPSNTTAIDEHDFDKVLYEIEHGHLPHENGQQSSDENEEEKNITLTTEELNTSPAKLSSPKSNISVSKSALEKELVKQSRIKRFGEIPVISNEEKIKSRKRRFSNSNTENNDPSTQIKLYSDFSLKSVLDVNIDDVSSLKEKISQRETKFGTTAVTDLAPFKKRKISKDWQTADKEKRALRMQRFGIIDEKVKIQNRKQRFAQKSMKENKGNIYGFIDDKKDVKKVAKKDAKNKKNNINVDLLMNSALGGKNVLLMHQTLDEFVEKQTKNGGNRGRGNRRRGRYSRGGNIGNSGQRVNVNSDKTGNKNSGRMDQNLKNNQSSKFKKRMNRFSDF